MKNSSTTNSLCEPGTLLFEMVTMQTIVQSIVIKHVFDCTYTVTGMNMCNNPSASIIYIYDGSCKRQA